MESFGFLHRRRISGRRKKREKTNEKFFFCFDIILKKLYRWTLPSCCNQYSTPGARILEKKKKSTNFVLFFFFQISLYCGVRCHIIF